MSRRNNWRDRGNPRPAQHSSPRTPCGPRNPNPQTPRVYSSPDSTPDAAKTTQQLQQELEELKKRNRLLETINRQREKERALSTPKRGADHLTFPLAAKRARIPLPAPTTPMINLCLNQNFKRWLQYKKRLDEYFTGIIASDAEKIAFAQRYVDGGLKRKGHATTSYAKFLQQLAKDLEPPFHNFWDAPQLVERLNEMKTYQNRKQRKHVKLDSFVKTISAERATLTGTAGERELLSVLAKIHPKDIDKILMYKILHGCSSFEEFETFITEVETFDDPPQPQPSKISEIRRQRIVHP